ncbi:MAG: AMP-binding protein [Pseudomonadota bacterium]|nr:AMP-binding protein [Pseudomonadota bacterium]
MQKMLKTLMRGVFQRLFRVRLRGFEHYPHGEPRVLIVANHVSFLDGALLSAFLPEVPVFVVNTHMAARWWVKPFVALTRHITIDPTNSHYLKTLIQHLKSGERVAIFPEGRITVTGALMKIYEGPALAADKAGAVILPVHIAGAEYTPLSRLKGKVRRRLFPPIRLTLLPPRRLDPGAVEGRARRLRLGRLLDDLMRELVYEGIFCRRPLFEAVVEARATHGGGSVVVEDSRRQPLNYRQLFARCFVLSALMARHSGGERRVGIMLPSAVGAVAAFLALHLRNQVPVVLNFTVGVQGLVAACQTAEVKTVYTSRAFIEGAKLEETVARLQEQVRVLFLEDLGDAATAAVRLRGLVQSLFPGRAYRRLAGPVTGDDPAVVLFTSGSEGLPKGVVLTHNNLLANHAQVCAMLALVPADRVLNALPLFHSFGLSTGTLVPLLSGIKVFLYPSPLHYHVIPELAYDQAASIVFGTNTFLLGYGRSADPYDFFATRLVVAGAEPLRPETRRLWAEKFGIRIIEGYGVTEAGPVLAANSFRHCRPGTVGLLMPGIDHYLEPVAGIANGGRLCVRGANVMAGYLFHDRPGIHPPQTDRGPGWYDTGDIVSIDADGFVTIQGRARRFAKIGGEMVSLATVERLAGHAWSDEQHVAVNLPDPAKGEQIVLLTTRRNAVRPDLVKAARELGIGEIHIPRQVLAVEGMPLLGSGKLDYAAARRLAEARSAAAEVPLPAEGQG